MRVRPAIDPELLAALSVPRVAPWLCAAVVDWLVVVAIFALVAWVDHPVAYALAVFPLGSRQQALGALFHDAAHHLITRRKGANDALGSVLAAWPLGLTLGGYRAYHFAHHRGLGTLDDPEMAHKGGLRQWHLPAAPLPVAASFAGDLVLGGIPHLVAAGRLTKPVSWRETLGIGAFWLGLLAIAYRAHLVWIPVLWIVSIATVFWSGVRLRIWTEHLGTKDTHRVVVPTWLAHAIMPHDIGLHWEHHWFPSVPFWNLAKLRAALPGPRVTLTELARAFLTSAPLPSGTIGETIDAEARTMGDEATVAAAGRDLDRLRYAGHVAVPLALGGFVYLGFRPKLPRLFAPLEALGFRGGLLEGYLPPRFVDVFPDVAWAYALTALLVLVWGTRELRGKLWIAVGPGLAAGWELGQLAGIFPGSYDLADLVFGVAGALAAVVICKEPALSLSPAAPAPKAE